MSWHQYLKAIVEHIRIWSNSMQVALQIWIQLLQAMCDSWRHAMIHLIYAMSWQLWIKVWKAKFEQKRTLSNLMHVVPKNIWIELIQETYLIWTWAMMHQFKKRTDKELIKFNTSCDTNLNTCPHKQRIQFEDVQ